MSYGSKMVDVNLTKMVTVEKDNDIQVDLNKMVQGEEGVEGFCDSSVLYNNNTIQAGVPNYAGYNQNGIQGRPQALPLKNCAGNYTPNAVMTVSDDQVSFERTEGLSENPLYYRLELAKVNQTQGTTSIFAAFIISEVKEIHFISLPEKIIFFIVRIRSMKNGEDSFLLTDEQWKAKNIIDALRLHGCVFVSKRSDMRKGELMMDYINMKKQKSPLLINAKAGWSLNGNSCFFMTRAVLGSDVGLFENQNIPIITRHLQLSGEKHSQRLVIRYWERLKLVKAETGIIFSFWLHHTLLAQPMWWWSKCRMERFLYVQTEDEEDKIAKLLYAIFLQIYNPGSVSEIPAESSTKTFQRILSEFGDECPYVRLHPDGLCQYEKRLVEQNLQYIKEVVEGSLPNGESISKSPAVFTNGFCAEIPAWNVMQVRIDSEEVDVIKIEQTVRMEYVIGDYVACFVEYIMANYKELQDDIIIYKAYGEICRKDTSSEFFYIRGLYQVVGKFLKSYGLDLSQYWGTEDELVTVLQDHFAENTAEKFRDLVPEIFREKIRECLGRVNVINRKRAQGYELNPDCVYDDEDFLYFTENQIEMWIYNTEFSLDFTWNEFLHELAEMDMIVTDKQLVRTYQRSVYFPRLSEVKSSTRKTSNRKRKMIAVRKKVIYELGEE